VTCIYSLINALERKYGVHWAVGGTGKLVQGLVSLLEGQGGVLRCNAEVKRIEVDQGVATGVTLASGERIEADIVVSNADTAWTYRNLIEAKHRRHWTDRKVENGRYSMSLFVWYFGTRRQYTDVPHHMMLLGPRYKELLKDIFRRHKLADDFSLYLHRPTASDASMAPAGHDTFYALAPVPHLDSGTDWATHAQTFRQAIAEVLDRTVLPGFEQHISASLLTTPQDFHDRLLSFKGAAAKRVVSPAQPQRRRGRALHGGRQHPPRRGCAGCADVGQGTRFGGSPGNNLAATTCSQTRFTLTPWCPAPRWIWTPAWHSCAPAPRPSSLPVVCCRFACAPRRLRSTPSAAWPTTWWTRAR
jgi:phytoene desaturase